MLSKDMVITKLKQKLESTEHSNARATRRLQHLLNSSVDMTLTDLVDDVVESFDKIRLESEFERSAHQKLIHSYEQRLSASVPVLLQGKLRLPEKESTKSQQTDPEHQSLIKQLISITNYKADSCNVVPDLPSMAIELVSFYSKATKDLETERDELSQAVNQQTDQYNLLLESQSTRQTAFEELAKTVDELKEEKQRFQSKLAASVSVNKKLQQEITSIVEAGKVSEQASKSSLLTAKAHVKSLTADLTNSRKQLALREQEVTSLQTQNQLLESLKSDNASLQKQSSHATHLIKDLKEKITQLENKKHDQLTLQEQELETLSSNFLDLQSEYDALQKRSERESHLMAELKNKLALQEEESAATSSEYLDLQSEYADLQKQFTEMKSSNNSLQEHQNAYLDLQQQFTAVKASNDSLQEQLDSEQQKANGSSATTNAEYLDLQSKYSDLQQQFTAMKTSNNTLKEQLDSEQQKTTSQQDKLLDLEILISALRQTNTDSHEDKAIADLKTENDDLRNQLDAEKQKTAEDTSNTPPNSISKQLASDLEVQNESLNKTVEQLVLELKKATEWEIENKILKDRIRELEEQAELRCEKIASESSLAAIINNDPPTPNDNNSEQQDILKLQSDLKKLRRDRDLSEAEAQLQICELESTIQSQKEAHTSELNLLKKTISDLSPDPQAELQYSIERSLRDVQGTKITSWGTQANDDVGKHEDTYSTDKSSEVSAELEKSMNEDSIPSVAQLLSERKDLVHDLIQLVACIGEEGLPVQLRSRVLSLKQEAKGYPSIECNNCSHLEGQLSIMRRTLGDAIDDRNAIEEELVNLKIHLNNRPKQPHGGSVPLDSSTVTIAVGEDLSSTSDYGQRDDKCTQTCVSMLKANTFRMIHTDRRRSRSAPPLTPSDGIIDLDCTLRSVMEPKSSSSSIITTSSVWSSRRGPTQAPLDVLMPPGGAFSLGGGGGGGGGPGSACPIPLATGSSFGSLVQIPGGGNFAPHLAGGRDTTPPYGYINGFSYTPDSTAPSSPEMSLKWAPAQVTSPKRNHFGRQRQPMLDLVLPPAPEKHRFVKRSGQGSPRPCNGREEELIDQLSIAQTESVIVGDACSTQAYTMSPSDTSESFSPPMSPAARRAFFNRHVLSNSPVPITLSPSHSNRLALQRGAHRPSVGVQTDPFYPLRQMSSPPEQLVDDDLEYSGGEEDER
eukprot:TRINITY_DN14499_c0_g1_i2.p1 TRINITY_DN14499_c0_g1~~TRINITY_DN14499_c0_g1_i2.p1  ORF type:complete len:1311 (+),score=353.38 TRINITY_DN14499_c0_g1_i2:358-3933(+)